MGYQTDFEGKFSVTPWGYKLNGEISALVGVTKAAQESMVNAVRSKYKAFNR